MSNFGGPNSQFEKDLNKRLKPLTKRLTKIENKIQKLLVESVNNAKKTNIYWNAVRRELDKLYAEMNSVFASWSETQIPRRYRKSITQIAARIEANKSILNTAKKSVSQVLTSNASSQIVGSLYQSAIDSYTQAAILGKRNMYTFTRLTQQTLINESLIDITIAQGFELGDLRKAANALSNQLWGELWNSIQKGHFVQAGRYKYTPEYYAELVARTKFHDAHSQAALVQSANYGTDLVQVSSHNTTTVICQEFEGKVFSISGKDKRFPILTQVPPYHPNCLHLIYPTFESAMIVQGTLDAFSAFSKNDINRPPVPSGFIPLSQRKAS
jgi:hypothetical protein